MKSGKLMMSMVATALILTACGEPKKYEYTNGEMGENTVATSPKESVQAIKEGKNKVVQEREIFLTEQAEITEPTDGLTLAESKALYTVNVLYTYLQNEYLEGVDNLFTSEALKEMSYSEYYKASLEDKDGMVLNYEVQVIDELEDDKVRKIVVIDVDTEILEDSVVTPYVNRVTVVEKEGVWLIESIETKEDADKDTSGSVLKPSDTSKTDGSDDAEN